MHIQKAEIYPKECNPVDHNGRQELNKLKLSGLTLTETLHAPSSNMPLHVHEAASICLTLTGQGIEIIDGVRVVTEPGCVIMRGPGMMHADQYGAIAHRGFMIELEQKWLNTCRHFMRVFADHRHFNGGLVPALALRIYRESRVKDSVAPVIVEGLMLEMLGQAEHYRTTVGEYVRRLRLDWATRQLSETEVSITEIALAAGFYDQSHFSHLFKQHTGFTPAEFRAFSNGAV